MEIAFLCDAVFCAPPFSFSCQTSENLKMPSKTTESITITDGNLEPHQDELQQLGELAGIYMDPKVFRILVELLNMGIDPDTIYNLLKTIKRSRTTKSRASVLSQKSARSKN